MDSRWSSIRAGAGAGSQVPVRRTVMATCGGSEMGDEGDQAERTHSGQLNIFPLENVRENVRENVTVSRPL